MPITRERFDRIKEKFWNVASWAVWADGGATAKSKVGGLRVLDPDLNPHLLRELKPEYFSLMRIVSDDRRFWAWAPDGASQS